MGSFDSIQNIRRFMNRFKIKESILFPAEVTAFNKDTVICRDRCMCKLWYNIQYGQFDIDIDWTINLSSLELHRGYNTNFQTFLFNDKSLEIVADTRRIRVTFKQ